MTAPASVASARVRGRRQSVTAGVVVAIIATLGLAGGPWLVDHTVGRQPETCSGVDSAHYGCIPTDLLPHDDGGYGTRSISAAVVTAVMSTVPLYPQAGHKAYPAVGERVLHLDGHLRYVAATQAVELFTTAAIPRVDAFYAKVLTGFGWAQERQCGIGAPSYSLGSRTHLCIVPINSPPTSYALELEIWPYPCPPGLSRCGYSGSNEVHSLAP